LAQDLLHLDSAHREESKCTGFKFKYNVQEKESPEGKIQTFRISPNHLSIYDAAEMQLMALEGFFGQMASFSFKMTKEPQGNLLKFKYISN
jgi:hypothetical protein